MNSRRISQSERMLIYKNYDDGKNPMQIDTKLEFNRKTVTSIINLYKSTGRIQAKETGSKEQKIANDSIQLIQKMLKKMYQLH